MAADKFPIEGSHIMMFARSIADDNQIYYDADYAEKTNLSRVIAPPTFVQSSAQFDPNYVLRPRIGKDWFGSGKEATSIKEKELSVTSGGLHAEQHFEYHRHIGPGDILTAEVKPGKTWEKEGKRSGKEVFNETITENRDQHGELAITARGVGVRPERPVDQQEIKWHFMLVI